MSDQKFPSLDPTEKRLIAFDFTDDLDPDTTLSSAAIDITLISGADISPTAFLLGLPTIEGTIVRQWVQASVVAAYRMKCRVTTSSSERLALSAVILVQEGG
ncbi:MAG: hypothetical protein JWL63_3226 [Rhodocyclales bacterium]|nr:hypothetical protein [Rhodocyclales bacterium]